MKSKLSVASVFDLYTDGGCWPNPGRGGWGFILRDHSNPNTIERFGGCQSTTNNAMEITAVLEGLKETPEGSYVEVFTDSRYVANAMNRWIKSWQKNDWQRHEDGELVPVKNVNLWQHLWELMQSRSVRAIWVKGHNGHWANERCDELAKRGMNSVSTAFRKCLSIRQPWASLIAHGQKSVEIRTWATDYRGEIYLHAGKTSDSRSFVWDKCSEASRAHAKASLGGIVARANLVDCLSYDRDGFIADHPLHLNNTEWFEEGKTFGFVFADVELIDFEPVRGMLGIFTL